MVSRKQAGLSHKQLAATTDFRVHQLRRWEFDCCQPTGQEWDQLRKFLKLPPKPILTFAQPELPSERYQSIGDQLRRRRLELKFTLAEAAPQIGVSVPTLGLWELDKVFPKNCYHLRISTYLGYNPFPK